MKNKSLIILFLAALFGFMACEEEGGPIFVAKPSDEQITFTNTFSSEYLLTAETEDNVAERFVWNEVDFGAPVNITYELQASIDSEFATYEVVGSTSENNVAVSVGQLLEFAEDLGLDDDPSSTDDEGAPNNTGSVYFRLRAFTGSGTANSVEQVSAIQALSIKWIEKMGDGCASMFIVGEAAVEAGWAWSTPVVLECEGDILRARLTLTNGTFRFFEQEGNWDSGQNYPYFVAEGYTIDANFEDAADGDNNFRFIGTPGIYEIVLDKNEKTITLNASTPYYLVGDAVPNGWNWADAVEVVETAPYVRTATLTFSTGAFRFFTNYDDWNSGHNFPYYEDLGYTIDSNFENANDGDLNFQFVGTPGSYTLTLNEKEKTITLQ